MKIVQKKIRNTQKHLFMLNKGEKFFLGVDISNIDSNILDKIGFDEKPEPGNSILSFGGFGNISLYNSVGKNEIIKNEPMEIAYRVIDWHWKDWGGNEHSKLVDVPYKRYPRKFIKPPSLEFLATTNNLLVINKKFEYKSEDDKLIKHAINLLLEIFGECEIYNEDLEVKFVPKMKRLNWRLLPEGQYPWKRLKVDIKNLISSVREGNKPPTISRLKFLVEKDPNLIAVGRAGFSGCSNSLEMTVLLT